MSFELSLQIKLVALVGLVAALAMAGVMFFLSRPADPEGLSAGELAAALTPVEKAPAAPAGPAQKAAEPESKPEPKPAVAPNGLPIAVAEALQRQRVAVVALFASGARIDQFSIAEARAGAKSAGAAFVALDVLSERNAEPLAKLLDAVVEPPAVLVYHRPAALFVKLDGFADRETIAQAAVNAGVAG